MKHIPQPVHLFSKLNSPLPPFGSLKSITLRTTLENFLIEEKNIQIKIIELFLFVAKFGNVLFSSETKNQLQLKKEIAETMLFSIDLLTLTLNKAHTLPLLSFGSERKEILEHSIITHRLRMFNL